MKTLFGPKPLRVRFDEVDVLLEFIMELDIYHYFFLRYLMSFTVELAKKVALHMFLLILWKLCKLIPKIHYLQKKHLICVML